MKRWKLLELQDDQIFISPHFRQHRIDRIAGGFSFGSLTTHMSIFIGLQSCRAGFLKIISVGMTTYAGVKTGF